MKVKTAIIITIGSVLLLLLECLMSLIGSGRFFPTDLALGMAFGFTFGVLLILNLAVWGLIFLGWLLKSH